MAWTQGLLQVKGATAQAETQLAFHSILSPLQTLYAIIYLMNFKGVYPTQKYYNISCKLIVGVLSEG